MCGYTILLLRPSAFLSRRPHSHGSRSRRLKSAASASQAVRPNRLEGWKRRPRQQSLRRNMMYPQHHTFWNSFAN